MESNLSSEKTYYNWIDWVKTFGLILVILGHGDLVSESVQKYIYSFHMPLFFVLSGFLYHPRDIKNTIKRDWKRLLIPYLIINFTILIWQTFVEIRAQVLTRKLVFSHIIPIIFGTGRVTDNLIPVCTPGWFIIALFFIHIFYSSIGEKSRKININFFLIVCSCGVSYLASFSERIFYTPFFSAVMALPFFSAGILIKYFTISNFSINRQYRYIIGFLFIVVWFFSCKNNGRCDINTVNFGGSCFLFYFTAFCGVFAILLFGSNINIKNKAVNLMGGVVF